MNIDKTLFHEHSSMATNKSSHRDFPRFSDGEAYLQDVRKINQIKVFVFLCNNRVLLRFIPYLIIPDLSSFKVALKNWRPVNCPGRICKVYIGNVSFV